MNKEQLIASATKRYHEQLQREYNYRQAIRDGLIQPFDAKTIEYWDNTDCYCTVHHRLTFPPIHAILTV